MSYPLMQTEIFTDGSCFGNPGPGGYCTILRSGKHEKIVSGGEKNVKSNRMELRAVVESLKVLKMPCEITLCSDSRYVVDGINGLLKRWVPSCTPES